MTDPIAAVMRASSILGLPPIASAARRSRRRDRPSGHPSVSPSVSYPRAPRDRGLLQPLGPGAVDRDLVPRLRGPGQARCSGNVQPALARSWSSDPPRDLDVPAPPGCPLAGRPPVTPTTSSFTSTPPRPRLSRSGAGCGSGIRRRRRPSTVRFQLVDPFAASSTLRRSDRPQHCWADKPAGAVATTRPAWRRRIRPYALVELDASTRPKPAATSRACRYDGGSPVHRMTRSRRHRRRPVLTSPLGLRDRLPFLDTPAH